MEIRWASEPEGEIHLITYPHVIENKTKQTIKKQKQNQVLKWEPF